MTTDKAPTQDEIKRDKHISEIIAVARRDARCVSSGELRDLCNEVERLRGFQVAIMEALKEDILAANIPSIEWLNPSPYAEAIANLRIGLAAAREECEKMEAWRDTLSRTATYWWREWHAASGRKRPTATDAGVNEACKQMDAQDKKIETLTADLAAARKESVLLAKRITNLRAALESYGECGDGCTCGDGWDHSLAEETLAHDDTLATDAERSER